LQLDQSRRIALNAQRAAILEALRGLRKERPPSVLASTVRNLPLLKVVRRLQCREPVAGEIRPPNSGNGRLRTVDAPVRDTGGAVQLSVCAGARHIAKAIYERRREESNASPKLRGQRK
jgi:hypothetical protein